MLKENRITGARLDGEEPVQSLAGYRMGNLGEAATAAVLPRYDVAAISALVSVRWGRLSIAHSDEILVCTLTVGIADGGQADGHSGLTRRCFRSEEVIQLFRRDWMGDI